MTNHTNNPNTANALFEHLVVPDAGYCFHCGDPVPTPPFYAQILGETREMCCLGCQLAAESIVEAGLEQYYLDRTEINRTASLPAQMTQLEAYDHAEIKAQFVYLQDGLSVAELSVNNLRCAACTWLIETRLYELEGVEQCQVNLTNQRMRVIWDEQKLPISQILLTINQIGYDAKPYRQDTHEAMLARHNKQMLIRLGIAALGAMQAMMFAVGMYFGEYRGMLVAQRDFLRWVSLFVSVPVFFYSGLPFYLSAWAAIKARQVNMDVPVSIALTVTFFASLFATISGQGETYYDSVSMFIFFLLAGRYIEHNARLKAANMANDLVVLEPTLVKRLSTDTQLASMAVRYLQVANFEVSLEATTNDNDQENSSDSVADQQHFLQQLANLAQYADNLDGDGIEVEVEKNKPAETNSSTHIKSITAQALQIGDVILVEAGSDVPADGVLCSQSATVSQSLLTGESDLIVKQCGDAVIGGSQNDSQPFVMLVTALPKDSQIGLIDRLMNRAMSEKPKIAQKADKWARWFVARVLVFSIVVFVGWCLYDPNDISQAIWATVAVLVATCPCALSLATPIALTVATNRLAHYGFLATRGHTLQTLAEVTHIAFDKTGTLTYGQPNLLHIEALSQSNDKKDTSAQALLAIAAAMEVGSRHPIAYALLTAAYQLHLPSTQALQLYPAGGVQAQVDGVLYRLGHMAFATNQPVNQSVNQSIMAEDTKLSLSSQKSSRTSPLKMPDLQQYNASSVIVLSRLSGVVDTLDEDNKQQNSKHHSEHKKAAGNLWQPVAYFYFNDAIREDMVQMITNIKARGITPLMLTGDPSKQAFVVAKKLGIEHAYHGLSPKDKVTHIQDLQQQGAVVMMVGDGINDAPVLAAADISTSIAGAADLAQVSSDSVILDGKVQSVIDAKRVADKAHNIIKQNLYWALGYNTVVLIPAALGYVPPWLAAIGMSLSSLLVVLNALRLKRV
ncbi:heavy metal translocating P-type ATPase [Psychrobacter sp. I-STPA10]|uniref:heavy metal translocating P-type ATPase n=1 Tax=Psychrobacter sp. I-STPA10 TaxID=2585769 RepID=UPI001E41A5C1|nr:heavy metal translocating P-type ATPase [Psychrobacter sp. I-STPA10]